MLPHSCKTGNSSNGRFGHKDFLLAWSNLSWNCAGVQDNSYMTLCVPLSFAVVRTATQSNWFSHLLWLPHHAKQAFPPNKSQALLIPFRILLLEGTKLAYHFPYIILDINWMSDYALILFYVIQRKASVAFHIFNYSYTW